jgi:hypothetical protein
MVMDKWVARAMFLVDHLFPPGNSRMVQAWVAHFVTPPKHRYNKSD